MVTKPLRVLIVDDEQATDKRPYIIAITGRGMRADKVRSRECGIDLHLVKPVEPETLETVLQGLAGK